MNDSKTYCLDIGCSKYKKAGFIGIDILRNPNIDVVADARQLPFKDNSIDAVYSRYALEHIPDNLKVLSELWRTCKPGAQIQLILPHFSNPSYYDDLTHVYQYSTRSFEHYDHEMHKITGHPNYLPDVNLKVTYTELRWWPPQVIERKSFYKRQILNFLNRIIIHKPTGKKRLE